MAPRPVLIAVVALAVIVVAFVLWWPSAFQAVQAMHGPFGGGPGMHGLP